MLKIIIGRTERTRLGWEASAGGGQWRSRARTCSSVAKRVLAAGIAGTVLPLLAAVPAQAQCQASLTFQWDTNQNTMAFQGADLPLKLIVSNDGTETITYQEAGAAGNPAFELLPSCVPGTTIIPGPECEYLPPDIDPLAILGLRTMDFPEQSIVGQGACAGQVFEFVLDSLPNPAFGQPGAPPLAPIGSRLRLRPIGGLVLNPGQVCEIPLLVRAQLAPLGFDPFNPGLTPVILELEQYGECTTFPLTTQQSGTGGEIGRAHV